MMSWVAVWGGLGYVAWGWRADLAQSITERDRHGALLRVRGSHLGNLELMPNTIFVFEDHLETEERGFFKSDTQTIRYSRVAQVVIRRGVVWTTLGIESTGGNLFVAKGLRNAEAEHAKREIEARAARSERPLTAPVQPQPMSGRVEAAVASPATSTGDRLSELDALRQARVITDEEYAEQRARILAGI